MRISKQIIRKDVRLRIEMCCDRDLLDQQIQNNILESPEFRNSDIVLAYAAMIDEVNLSNVITAALEKGKQLYLPRIAGEYMKFHLLESPDALETGSYNISEPSAEAAALQLDAPFQAGKKVLVLVPGRAFSQSGHRLGRGKGYYDKYFKSFEKNPFLFMLGVAYTCQVYEDVPYCKHDVKMKGIVDQNYVHYTTEA